jgi:cyclophilin family peptidyl-prolyl cis-trans isomerase
MKIIILNRLVYVPIKNEQMNATATTARNSRGLLAMAVAQRLSSSSEVIRLVANSSIRMMVRLLNI